MKVLVIRFSSIGDIVLTTPVVRGLQQQLGAEVHYLTKRAFRSIVATNPHISKVYAIERKVSEALPALKQEGYDGIIDLHRNLRSAQVKWALGRPAYAFDKLNWEKWLLVNLRIDRLPAVHIVDRYLAAVQPLGVQPDGQGLDFFIPEEDEVDTARFFARQALGPPEPPPPYVAFAIGAAHATKRLPTAQIIEICQGLSSPVVLLGGPGDADAGQEIAAAVGERVHNTCGLLNLHQSASLVRQAAKVITHDTGMMHIAAAFAKDIISVWGNTVPAFGMYPYYPPNGPGRNTTVEVPGLRCRPCSKIGYARCPKGHFRCMRNISAQIIVSEAERRSEE
jgi:ADP-heptose:LPS heptosyltransferase